MCPLPVFCFSVVFFFFSLAANRAARVMTQPCGVIFRCVRDVAAAPRTKSMRARLAFHGGWLMAAGGCTSVACHIGGIRYPVRNSEARAAAAVFSIVCAY